MFREFKHVRQEPGLRRRWFEAREADLVIWYDPAGAETGFQLIYASPGGDRALTWRRGLGFTHSRVDSGEDSPLKNLTPILLADGAIPWGQVEDLFKRNSASLEPDLRNLVSARLQARQ